MALEVGDEGVLCRAAVAFGIARGRFQALEAFGQALLLLLVTLAVHQVLLLAQNTALVVGVKIGEEVPDPVQLLLLHPDLLFDINARFGRYSWNFLEKPQISP